MRTSSLLSGKALRLKKQLQAVGRSLRSNKAKTLLATMQERGILPSWFVGGWSPVSMAYAHCLCRAVGRGLARLCRLLHRPARDVWRGRAAWHGRCAEVGSRQANRARPNACGPTRRNGAATARHGPRCGADSPGCLSPLLQSSLSYSASELWTSS